MRIHAPSQEIKDSIPPLIREIEELRERKVFCLYQDLTTSECLTNRTVAEAKGYLKRLGHVDKMSVIVESPGGDPDAAFRLATTFRRYTDDLEAIVYRWAKSGATFFCLSANKILMGDDAELGPLDVQLPDPRGGGVSYSALNDFKSLEYLREHVVENLNYLIELFLSADMDFQHALEAATPLASAMVTPLYQQVDPEQLGEARRHLAVGEEYSRIVMERYSYRHLSVKEIKKIVRDLVWNYPSHGFVLDRDEALALGLTVEPLDARVSGLVEAIVTKAYGCVGCLIEEAPAQDAVEPPEAELLAAEIVDEAEIQPDIH